MTGHYKKPEKIFAVINAVSEVLSLSNEPQRLLDMVLDTLLEVLQIDCCWVQLLNSKSRKLSLACYRGFTPDMKQELDSTDSGWNLSNMVAGVGHRIVIPDLATEVKYNLPSFKKEKLRSLVVVPLRNYRLLGVMGIASRNKKGFSTEVTDLFVLIASLVSVALDKANLFQRSLIYEANPNSQIQSETTPNSDNGEYQRNVLADLKGRTQEWSEAADRAVEAAEKIRRLSPAPQAELKGSPHKQSETVDRIVETVEKMHRSSLTSPAEFKEPTQEQSDTVDQIFETTEQTYKSSPLLPAEVPSTVQETYKIKVFIVDKEVIFRQALSKYLSQTLDIDVIGESDNFVDEVVALIEEVEPDVVLIDYDLPSLNGLILTRKITQYSPRVSVILVAPYEDDKQILEALKAGAVEYLSRGSTGERFANAIRDVHNRESIVNELLIRPGVARLALNELRNSEKSSLSESINHYVAEILSCLAEGYSLSQVQRVLNISERDIAVHLSSFTSQFVMANSAGNSPPFGK